MVLEMRMHIGTCVVCAWFWEFEFLSQIRCLYCALLLYLPHPMLSGVQSVMERSMYIECIYESRFFILKSHNYHYCVDVWLISDSFPQRSGLPSGRGFATGFFFS